MMEGTGRRGLVHRLSLLANDTFTLWIYYEKWTPTDFVPMDHDGDVVAVQSKLKTQNGILSILQ